MTEESGGGLSFRSAFAHPDSAQEREDMEVEVGELIESISHDYPDKSVHLKFYRCLWRRHEPRALGCHAFAWVSVSQLARYTFPPADEQVLEKLRASTRLWNC